MLLNVIVFAGMFYLYFYPGKYYTGKHQRYGFYEQWLADGLCRWADASGKTILCQI